MTRNLVNILVICQICILIGGTGDDATNFIEPVSPGANLRALKGGLLRIVGGSPADIRDYPFMFRMHDGKVLDRFRLNGDSAAGIIVEEVTFFPNLFFQQRIAWSGKYWELENPKSFLIVAGSANLWYSPSWQISNTDAVIPHSYFDFHTMANDIGVFRLTRTLRITKFVNFVAMPYGVDNSIFRKKNQTCTVIGWGKTSSTSTTTSDILRQVDVPLIGTRECSRYYSWELHRSQICAGRQEGGVDACQGDSGGPLLCNGIQIGVVSWGIGCAARNYPGVYTRVDHYLNWIKNAALRSSGKSNGHHGLLSIIFPLFYFSRFVCKIFFDNL